MNEEYVNKEITRKLIYKGFPVTEVFISDDRPILYELPKSDPNWFKCKAWYIPTISQVLTWLREEKNIFVVVFIDDDSDCPVTYNIFKGTDCVCHHHEEYFALSEWSKCEMAGIEYVIDNLI